MIEVTGTNNPQHSYKASSYLLSSNIIRRHIQTIPH